MTSQKKSVAPRLAGLTLASALLASSLVGCGAEETQTVTEDVYCTTADGTIVDEDRCEEDHRSGGGGVYFLSYGSYGSGHQPGHKLSGGNRIAYNDTGQRKALGLPESGKVTGKSGGFGSTITRSVPGAKSSGGKAGGFGGGGSSGG